MRAKSDTLDEIRKSIAESDDDATRSSSGGGSSATHQRQIDLSLLRKPILTAVTGFMEAQKAYQAGTEEIRKLLASECDVLYECRVCRNIFRSLTNFVSHKRVYCRKLFNAAQHFHFQNDGFLDQDIATIVQAEQDSQHKAKKVHADVLNKDLSSIIERLRRNQHRFRSESTLTDYYAKINHKLTQDDLNRQQHLLQLDQVPNSQAAVYQTIRHDVIEDNMRSQVRELENLVDKDNIVVGPDGKVIEPMLKGSSTTLPVIFDPTNCYFQPIELDRANDEDRVNRSTNNSENPSVYRCQECNLQFDTEKMLKLHGEMKHTPSTYVYSCPSCTRTFLQPGSVIRHLSNDHQKSMRRIKQMRDTILKRRTRIDEVVVKGPSRELSRLLQSTGGSTNSTNSSADYNQHPDEERDEAAATRAWMENLEHFDQGPMCSYCGKTFERKAVLSTHMQTCAQKIRQTENGASSVPPSSSASSASGRRSKVKHASPALAVTVKQEPVDPPSSDDSNSIDVPLSALQARISQQVKKDDSSQIESVLTIKPEELVLSGSNEEGSRRKRKKPTIMLRNASDDISWEVDEQEPKSVEDSTNATVQIKQEPVEVVEMKAPKAKRGPRNRKKQAPEEEMSDKDMKERLEADGNIVCRCSKRYDDPEKYKRHLRVFHSRQRRFWCAVCDFKGYRKIDTVNHLLQEHSYKGDPEDICSLINFQPVEKFEKLSIEEPKQSIESVIEAVSRSCDTNATDISFAEFSADKTGILNSKSISHKVPTLEGGSPNKRSRSKTTQDTVCSSDDSKSKTKCNATEDDSSSPTSKRPIRNRVKPVDKDFVYDLTHFMYKDEEIYDYPLPEPVLDKPLNKPNKFEPSLPPAVSPPEKRETKREALRSHAPKPKPVPSELTRGAAYQMAKRQVDLGLAMFFRPPDIPQERAFIPKKMSPLKQQRSLTSLHDWPVVKKDRKIGSITKQPSDTRIKRQYTKRASTVLTGTTSLPELIREKRKAIPRRNSVVPLPQKLSASIEILNKLNASRSAAGLDVVRMSDIPVMAKCPTQAEFRRYIEANLKDHRAKMSQVNLNGTTAADLSEQSVPRKRITLMQRLAENRSKRMQENGIPVVTEQQTQSIESSPSGASKSINVTELLQAKLKRFSSM
ncbi:uncharacterized protein LOC131684188 [Topomyia yanbarensis]|uniref:uncharacterized protein LOC131684188 n=1 Tax=Topomyia yanbarensis TaxID=2498891 RepID=UPI00273AB5AD|nr:uncharacterized protein LOC131684188 [Topomyia yanbarensis]XP_058822840.1 uncharacterized protein LOC131684188 [Topomyia yanbarensis]XP_058822848.1 uncharacterized protein LOC131684188 [Topomyia yanbarensis]XP_058822856.1 uncharacterized protein LOC131684188 [Topomyia yanbarensis]XP_058822866.1 uncharacterized protein LOC131684188 [Topomyia yanbarensis]XP_058822874.1 uncharacterized protein LOC131684188 [Topomyia yanbarensis]XP_058822883.1 uncharacterized protein LOC131684188 [Topomyia yan